MTQSRSRSRAVSAGPSLFDAIDAPSPPLRVMTIASSSSGNALYVRAGDCHVLIDVGVSARRIERALAAHGVPLAALDWVLVTHAHSDHCSGLATLLRRCKARVLATSATLRAVAATRPLPAETHELPLRQSVPLGAIEVTAVPTPHDAAGSVALQCQAGGRRLAVVTDLGVVTPEVKALVRAAHVAVVESNHCVERLSAGRYPPSTKRRILSDRGHLSNDAAAALVATCGTTGLRRVICAHLSRENNRPGLAEATMRAALAGVPHLRACEVHVAAPAEPSPMFEV